MGRTIITATDIRIGAVASGVRDVKPQETPGSGAAASAPVADGYQDRLIKYIPGDVIAVYLAIAGILKTANERFPVHTFEWVVFFVLLPGTWLYLKRVGHVTKWRQILVSEIAFVVWVFSLGGPFTQFSWYDPIYGAIVLPLYTFLVPIFEPAS